MNVAKARSTPALLTAALALAALASPAGAAGRPGTPVPSIAAPGLDRAPASVAAPAVGVAPGVTGLAATAWRRADVATEEKVNGWMENLASGWATNRGQIADANGHVAAGVYFVRLDGSGRHLEATLVKVQ